MTAELDVKQRSLNRKKLLKAISLFVLVLMFLFCTSFMATFGIAEGAYPAGEYRLTIQNSQGEPIQGAILNIYNAKNSSPAFQFPYWIIHIDTLFAVDRVT